MFKYVLTVNSWHPCTESVWMSNCCRRWHLLTNNLIRYQTSNQTPPKYCPHNHCHHHNEASLQVGRRFWGSKKLGESTLVIEKDLMSRLIKQGEENNLFQARCSEMILNMNQLTTSDAVTLTNMFCTDLARLHPPLLLSHKEEMYKLHSNFKWVITVYIVP